MVAERFKSAGLREVMAVVNDVEAVWPKLAVPAAYEVDALWKQS